MSGTVGCCMPRITPGPSRTHAYHAANCPDHAGEEIRLYPVPVPIPTQSELKSSMDVHPTSAVRAWRVHPESCPCSDCAWSEFWLDRDD